MDSVFAVLVAEVYDKMEHATQTRGAQAAEQEAEANRQAAEPSSKTRWHRHNARDFLTALVAITSDGQKVTDNFNQAADIYQRFGQNGILPTSGTYGGQRIASVSGNLRSIQSLLDDLGPEVMHSHLLVQKNRSRPQAKS